MSGPDTHEDPVNPRFEGGTGEDLDRLIERHLPWIQSYVHHKLSDFLRLKAETGDIVQDAVVQFLHYGPRFRLSDDGQFRALLGRIIENVLCDKYDWFTAKRRAIAKERPLPPDTVLNLDPSEARVESPSRIVQQHEQEAWIRLGLELLRPQERRIIILRDWEDLSFAEIAGRLDLSKSAARRKYLSSIEELIRKVRDLQSGRLEAALGMDAD